MNVRKWALCLLVFFFSHKTQAQSADQIISGFTSFTGGEQKWKAINTVISSGTYNYGGLSFQFTAYSKRPNLYRYIVTSNGKNFQQGYDGTEGWSIDGFKNETKKTIQTGRRATAMANEADVELESPLINYKEKGHRAILEGKDTVDGHAAFKIQFIRNNNDTETYFFNAADFSLLKKQARSTNEELDSSMLDVYYTDYRTVDGIKMPFTITYKSAVQTILTITLEKVKLNEPVPEEGFRP